MLRYDFRFLPYIVYIFSLVSSISSPLYLLPYIFLGEDCSDLPADNGSLLYKLLLEPDNASIENLNLDMMQVGTASELHWYGHRKSEGSSRIFPFFFLDWNVILLCTYFQITISESLSVHSSCSINQIRLDLRKCV